MQIFPDKTFRGLQKYRYRLPAGGQASAIRFDLYLHTCEVPAG